MDNGESITGKEGEYKVITKLMREGFPVYVPTLDVHGVDCVIKNKHGRLIEIQIKTRTGESFNKEFVIKREFIPNKDFFVCCYLIDKDDIWFIPSFVFSKLCNRENGSCILTMNLENEKELTGYRGERGFYTLNLEMP
jgi:hypothetical protein